MRKTPKNQGKQLSKEDIDLLKQLSEGNCPTGLIAYKMGRSVDSVRSKSSKEGISLKPTNQSPYDRKISNEKKGKK